MKSVDLLQVYMRVVEIKSVFKKKKTQLLHKIWHPQNNH